MMWAESLEVLQFFNVQIPTDSLSFLCYLKKLTSLHIELTEGCQIQATMLDAMTHPTIPNFHVFLRPAFIPDLAELFLAEVPLNKEDFAALGKFPNLHTVDISLCSEPRKVAIAFDSLADIKNLSIRAKQVGQVAVPYSPLFRFFDQRIGMEKKQEPRGTLCLDNLVIQHHDMIDSDLTPIGVNMLFTKSLLMSQSLGYEHVALRIRTDDFASETAAVVQDSMQRLSGGYMIDAVISQSMPIPNEGKAMHCAWRRGKPADNNPFNVLAVGETSVGTFIVHHMFCKGTAGPA